MRGMISAATGRGTHRTGTGGLALAGCLALLCLASTASAAPPTGDGSGGVALTEVGSFDRPIYADDAPGTGSDLYVVESQGIIRVLSGTTVRPGPFLDIRDIVSCCGEEGLFSIAFHPKYRKNGLFYVYFNNRAGDLVLMEFRRNRKNRFLAKRSSGRTVLYIPHPDNSNHNGGTIGFGPDGYLYLAPGDGGSGGDPPDNAQSTDRLLGKLLRIDPLKSCTKRLRVKRKRKQGFSCRKYNLRYRSAKGNPFFGATPGRDEIYALGLRNPFRWSFDAETGAIAIGDVGQGCREEIDYRGRGRARGVNFGWSGYEGTHVFDSGRIAPDVVFPILEYDNSSAGPGCPPLGGFQGTSVIAGRVVRDPRLAHQYGRLLYSDAANPDLRSLIPSETGALDDQSTGLALPGSPFGFAEGAGNQIFIVTGDGPIYRLDPA